MSTMASMLEYVCSLTYVTVDQVAAVAASLSWGALLAKTLLHTALYQSTQMIAVFWGCIGMVPHYFVDAMLLFGLRSAPKIFTALERFCRNVSFVWYYNDDFILLRLLW